MRLVWVWVPCPFLCVYMWGEGVNIRLRAWGWGHMLVYMCACRLRLWSGRALDSASLIILVDPHPTTMPWPVEDAAGALVDFSRRGRMLGERRPSLGGRLAGPGPTGLAGPDCGVGGAFGSPGPGPVRPGMVGCRWSLRACRHGTWGAYTVAVGGPAFGPSSALFWVEAAVVPAVVLLGVPCPGGLWMFWGPGLFHAYFMPCGMGCCSPHTLLNIYMEEPYEHKRAHTHRCTLKHSHWCKNRCSQTHIVLICCCFKTILYISYVCCSITFNI